MSRDTSLDMLWLRVSLVRILRCLVRPKVSRSGGLLEALAFVAVYQA
jgi:hypothetical protein